MIAVPLKLSRPIAALLAACLFSLIQGCGAAVGPEQNDAGFAQGQNGFPGGALAPSLPGTLGDPDPGFDPQEGAGVVGVDVSVSIPELQCTNVPRLPNNRQFFIDLKTTLEMYAATTTDYNQLSAIGRRWSRTHAFSYISPFFSSQIQSEDGNYTCLVVAEFFLNQSAPQTSEFLEEYPTYSAFLCYEDPNCQNRR